jgi:hypothetical protein
MTTITKRMAPFCGTVALLAQVFVFQGCGSNSNTGITGTGGTPATGTGGETTATGGTPGTGGTTTAGTGGTTTSTGGTPGTAADRRRPASSPRPVRPAAEPTPR